MNLKYFFCLLGIGLFLFLNSKSFGQQRLLQFTSDSVKFVDELDKFLTDEKNREGKALIKKFEKIWFNNALAENYRRDVYAVGNKMLEKRYIPFPEFEVFVELIIAVHSNEKGLEIYDELFKGINSLLEVKQRRKYTDYILWCTNLLNQNALYSSNSTNWKFSEPSYKFAYENDNALVSFEKIKLVCEAKGDSSIIRETKGVYNHNENEWIGQGGRINWARSGFSEEQVSAELSDYKINMRFAGYEAENVVFRNTIFFGEEYLKGTVVEKVIANVNEENASYPQFESKDRRFLIGNIVDKVDFEGGFKQNGSRFIGYGPPEELASITVRKDGKPFLVAKAESFIIRTDQISSASASVSIYLDNDSIYHSGLKFRLNTFERTLSLIRGDIGQSRSPYFNTFHELDMYFESLFWIIDDTIMEFKPLFGSTNKEALFESNQFYKAYRYDNLRGIDQVHPLVNLKRAVDYYERQNLTAEEVAKIWKISPNVIRPELMRLSYLGYVTYNYNDNTVYIQDKATNHVLAKAKRVDYDVLQFNSIPKGDKNATLNLNNYNLEIEGLKAINLSDSHNVYVFPYDKKINMGKNRDFTFDGVVTAGRFEYFGYNFDFNYGDFLIDMPEIDSLRMYVESENVDKYGKKEFILVKTTIEDIKGKLEIDRYHNKSGLKMLKKYPIFTSEQESYTYYDKGVIHGGVYERDSFYFKLEPFVFDSLDNFKNEKLAFEGRFFSNNIFPEFDETLKLQPDFSLGFVRPTPPEGYPVYKGKGKFTNDINLSNQGLKGDGTLEYLTATANSKDFTFFPDSVNALCENFIIEEQLGKVEYPPVSGQSIYMHWIPKGDIMEVSSTTTPFIFYDGESKFNGTLTYTPDELVGNGLFKFKNAELESYKFNFKFYEFFADTADFRMLNESKDDKNPLNISTDNVKAHVDFKERKAVFILNDGTKPIVFHDNQYIAKLDRFTWYMDKEQLELSGSADQQAREGDLDLDKSKFTSINPTQDSLAFYSPTAMYDVKNKIIYAKEVKYVDVADAEIVPDSGFITIERRAKMRTLNNAQITANKITRYHYIYDATVNITGRRTYQATGKYDYSDENDVLQQIDLTDISVDSTVQTYAIGTITEQANFTLSPYFKFQGNLMLQAAKRGLVFTGTTLIDHGCNEIEKEWFKFSTEINPDEVLIPVEEVQENADNTSLHSGILLSEDPTSIYSSFISQNKKSTDIELLNATGYLFYNKSDEEYQIAEFEKLNQRNLPGNFLSLNTKTCEVYGQGQMNLGLDLGRIETQWVGSITNNTINTETEVEAVLLVDFFFVDKALKAMASDFEARTNLDGINFDRPTYKNGLQELVGKQEADRLLSNISLYQSFRKFPASLEKTMYLAEVKLNWNPETESYVSEGPIGVGNIQKTQINRRIPGKIELEKKRSGDVITIYLQPDKKTFYFFQYSREVMQAFSSNSDFNTAILELKSGKNKLKKEDKSQAKYSFIISSLIKVKQFTNKFEDLE